MNIFIARLDTSRIVTSNPIAAEGGVKFHMVFGVP
jgi:hypothetical protein